MHTAQALVSSSQSRYAQAGSIRASIHSHLLSEQVFTGLFRLDKVGSKTDRRSVEYGRY
jgi:hypothetical protein